MATPIKNRFEALQAQDPCASQPQETIIENIKKNDLLRKKSRYIDTYVSQYNKPTYRPDEALIFPARGNSYDTIRYN